MFMINQIFKIVYCTLFTILFLASCKDENLLPPDASSVTQISIHRIDSMPFRPKPYKYRDWEQTALEFDKYVFDFNQKGDFLPLIWLDGMKRNFPDTTFGIY